MIKEIILKNFQCHKHTRLVFHNGVNAITGSSDNGKSAIIRGIKWVLTNRPAGTAFIRHGTKPADETSVTIKTTKHSVSRVKNQKGVNKYVVDGKDYKAIRSSVPAQVLQALGIADCMFQGQFDQYFLVQDSPGEVARRLNEIVGLDSIDEILKRANALVRDTKKERDVLSGQLYALEKQEEAFEDLEAIGKLVRVITSSAKTHSKLVEDRKEMKRIIQSVDNLSDEIENLEPFLDAEEDVNKLFNLISKLNEAKKKRDNLSNLVDAIDDVSEEIKNTTEWLDVEAPATKIYDVVLKLETLIAERKSLIRHIDAIDAVERDTRAKEEELRGLVAQLDSTLDEAQVCPLCGHAFEEDQCL